MSSADLERRVAVLEKVVNLLDRESEDLGWAMEKAERELRAVREAAALLFGAVYGTEILQPKAERGSSHLAFYFDRMTEQRPTDAAHLWYRRPDRHGRLYGPRKQLVPLALKHKVTEARKQTSTRLVDLLSAVSIAMWERLRAQRRDVIERR